MNFQIVFNKFPEIEASAPGRVNLLGEHTDYNAGFVLPTAIPQRTIVQISLSQDGYHHLYSEDLDEFVTIMDTSHTPSGFASYIFGCIEVLKQKGYKIPPLNLYIKSAIPIGSGLSSSAALETATLRGIRQLLALPIDDVEIALFGQQAEIHYAGVQCGIMDEMASSLADTEHMLFLDTRNLTRRLLPLPHGTEIVVMHSGVPRSLASSGYNKRKAECEDAARLLRVKSLRDVRNAADAMDILPEPLRRRARHVITENNRVLQAVQIIETLDAQGREKFGKLMNASHASLRDDYEVSVPPLDTLVEILQITPGVFGAKLTGAGFGGACVALVASGEGKNIATKALEKYNNAGYEGEILVPSGDFRF